MLYLQQEESYIIGSHEAIQALAKKEEAYILVLSDSHGYYESFYAVLESCASKVDALVYCGDGCVDVVGVVEELANECPHSSLHGTILPPVVVFVRGNGDPEAFSYIKQGKNERIIIPQAQNLTICGKNVFVVHGHTYSVNYGLDYAVQVAERLGVDNFFYGHTHIPRFKQIKKTRFINPGSCVIPRGGYPPTCALVKMHKDFREDVCSFYEIKENRFGKVDLKPIHF